MNKSKETLEIVEAQVYDTIMTAQGVRVKQAEMRLTQLTCKQRLEVFSEFCTACGDKNPKCYCQNDD